MLESEFCEIVTCFEAIRRAHLILLDWRRIRGYVSADIGANIGLFASIIVSSGVRDKSWVDIIIAEVALSSICFATRTIDYIRSVTRSGTHDAS